MEKSTFGQDINTGNEVSQEVSDQRKKRPEVGAIWQRKAKNSETEYMTIRLRFTKEQLNKMAEAEANEAGEIEYDLVSFPNKFQKGDTKRPAFRIYEELS